jgi:hypothetical protein
MNRLMIAPAVLALSLAGLAATSATADAATGSAVTPLVNTSTITFDNSPTESVLCNFNASGLVAHPADIFQVHNKCSVRMFLHQNADGSGHALCIRPNSTATIAATYRQYKITENSSPC